MYYVYILKNDTEQKYIGVTGDLKKRPAEHNSGSTQTTKNRGEFRIIWYCTFGNKSLAYKFEKYLKSSSGHAFAGKHLL